MTEGEDSAWITGLTKVHAGAIPMMKVVHPEAQVTHDTANGSVDKKELTPYARSLTPEQARELIVNGILR
ncbi:MAG: SufD family Fe-S cluster assembly protein [Nitrospira sp.]|nr:SufD family Fe-S cluster assembly protein [Nitrospira sp.]